MTAQSKAPSSGWTVNGQRETTQVTNGQVIEGVTVDFTTGQGTTGSVFIPHAQYNAERVRAEVAAKAALYDSVHGLSAEAG